MALMDIGAEGRWDWVQVRAALVRARLLWDRSPGDGRWPFASDGPWHLMSREAEAGDYDARGGFDTSSDVPVRPLPLTREEVGARDAVDRWLALVPAEADRRLLIVCIAYHARGYRQLPWGRIMREVGAARGKGGLAKRYRAALCAIADALNAAEIRERNMSRGGMCAR
jgi:hypothetical protein